MTGPPESVFDWTKELDTDLTNQNTNNQAFSRKHWRLLQCQNGLWIRYCLILNTYIVCNLLEHAKEMLIRKLVAWQFLNMAGCRASHFWGAYWTWFCCKCSAALWNDLAKECCTRKFLMHSSISVAKEL